MSERTSVISQPKGELDLSPIEANYPECDVRYDGKQVTINPREHASSWVRDWRLRASLGQATLRTVIGNRG